jgi:hypothetical protein
MWADARTPPLIGRGCAASGSGGALLAEAMVWPLGSTLRPGNAGSVGPGVGHARELASCRHGQRGRRDIIRYAKWCQPPRFGRTLGAAA